jgi:hypothetical protein
MKSICCLLLSLSALGFAAPNEPIAPTPEALIRWHVYDLQDVLRTTSFPVRAGALLMKLGGKEVLVWSSTTSSNKGPSTVTFAVSKAAAKGWPCFVELEVEQIETDLEGMKVLRARICYLSPFGTPFYLDESAAGLPGGPSGPALPPTPDISLTNP